MRKFVVLRRADTEHGIVKLHEVVGTHCCCSSLSELFYDCKGAESRADYQTSTSETLRMLNTESVRADTEGVGNVIHLNAAGAFPMPRPVVDRLIEHVRREAEIGGYEAAAEAKQESEDVYRRVDCY